LLDGWEGEKFLGRLGAAKWFPKRVAAWEWVLAGVRVWRVGEASGESHGVVGVLVDELQILLVFGRLLVVFRSVIALLLAQGVGQLEGHAQDS
jgi:hypothetical protein